MKIIDFIFNTVHYLYVLPPFSLICLLLIFNNLILDFSQGHFPVAIERHENTKFICTIQQSVKKKLDLVTAVVMVALTVYFIGYILNVFLFR